MKLWNQNSKRHHKLSFTGEKHVYPQCLSLCKLRVSFGLNLFQLNHRILQVMMDSAKNFETLMSLRQREHIPVFLNYSPVSRFFELLEVKYRMLWYQSHYFAGQKPFCMCSRCTGCNSCKLEPPTNTTRALVPKKIKLNFFLSSLTCDSLVLLK